mmetsp:Transcript_69046/g.131640  ORF Transcript_69046/g.131640 Transcript_69046/m.131640 type:complete len:91 (-) Transcript_69046:1733-2005(-)
MQTTQIVVNPMIKFPSAATQGATIQTIAATTVGIVELESLQVQKQHWGQLPQSQYFFRVYVGPAYWAVPLLGTRQALCPGVLTEAIRKTG